MLRIALVYFMLVSAYGQDSVEKGAVSKGANGNEAVGVEVGVDFANQDPYLSDYYMRGPYLIYDCALGHWVCSRVEEFRRCERLRNSSLLLKNENLRCAPFRRYNSRQECVDKQLEMTERASTKRFCIHPEIRERQSAY